MRWILGLDLGPRSRGAVEFARWLDRVTDDEIVAVHVLEAEHMRAVLKLEHLDDVLSASRAAAAAAVQGTWRVAPPAVEVVQATTALDGLEEARARHRAGGIIIGRAAESTGLHVVRLGRVARRVVRALASTVAVVAPEFGAAETPTGPVVALTAMTDDSAAACQGAAALAAQAGLPFAVAHVANDPRRDGVTYLSRGTLDSLAARSLATARTDLSDWLRPLELHPAVAEVVQGDVLRSALAFLEEQRASVVFVGARPLSPIARLFAAGFGRDLAGSSPVPVVLVPPG